MSSFKSWSLLVLLPASFARADSPITSTYFARAYMDEPMVKAADKSRTMTVEIATYLCDPKVGIDRKAAVINALSWDIEGKHNARLFRYYLAIRYGKTLTDLTTADMTADELFCLGYLTVMDDYDAPEKALPYLAKARRGHPRSFTVAIVTALVKAQKAMGSSWATVWEVTERVLEDEKLTADLRPEARQIIVDYMIGYKDSTEGVEPPPPASKRRSVHVSF